MRATPLSALLLATLMVGCDRNQPLSPVAVSSPSMAVDENESWTLTTYYWHDGEWVVQTALDGAFLPADLRLGFNAHNWGPEYPEVYAGFDNVRAYGDIDLNPGLIDDFDNGEIDPVWEGSGGPCVWWWSASACENVVDGLLVVHVPWGPRMDDVYQIGGLNAGMVVHGEFDVQIDFIVPPSFHSLPGGQAVIMLCLWDEAYANGICNALYSGFYATWRGTDASGNVPKGFHVARLPTGDTQGKLRITRTRVHKGPVVESIMGSGHFTMPEGDWRTFNFTARRHADGTVDGQWERVRRAAGNAAGASSHGVITCFTVEGNQAWIAGYATGGLYTTPPDNRVYWRVVDNSQATVPAPDRISTQVTQGGPEYPGWYCANKPLGYVTLYDVEAGNIRIQH